MPEASRTPEGCRSVVAKHDKITTPCASFVRVVAHPGHAHPGHQRAFPNKLDITRTWRAANSRDAKQQSLCALRYSRMWPRSTPLQVHMHARGGHCCCAEAHVDTCVQARAHARNRVCERREFCHSHRWCAWHCLTGSSRPQRDAGRAREEELMVLIDGVRGIV